MLNVQNNFGQHTKCPLCKTEEDDQKHLIECLVIKIHCPDILNNVDSDFKDIYSDEIEKQNDISKLIDIAMKKRNQLMNML